EHGDTVVQVVLLHPAANLVFVRIQLARPWTPGLPGWRPMQILAYRRSRDTQQAGNLTDGLSLPSLILVWYARSYSSAWLSSRRVICNESTGLWGVGQFSSRRSRLILNRRRYNLLSFSNEVAPDRSLWHQWLRWVCLRGSSANHEGSSVD